MTIKKSKNRILFRAACMGIVLLAQAFIQFSLAQLTYTKGSPLPFGIEKSSKLGSSIDFFEELPTLNTDSAKDIDDLPGNRIGGLRFAHTFFTKLSPQNSGVIFTTEEGRRIWKVGIRSNGAYSLGVIFSKFQIPAGATVFLYNSDRSVILGPFTSKNQQENGEFSVAPIDGDELIVEYSEPVDNGPIGLIEIGEVKHDYRGLFLRRSPRFNQVELPCIPDISCVNQYDTLKQSTCLLIINGDTYCTGTFVNNTANDGKPYLITASHCLEDNWDYGSRIIAYLNYESPSCDPRIRGSEEFSISGSVCRALNTDMDFALIEFKEKPPLDYRLFLSGWSNSTETQTNGPFACIQHPNGETKKYCVEEDNLQILPNNSNNLDNENYWYVDYWEKGHTWSGSSGAGLFDKNNRVIGFLKSGFSGGLFGCEPYSSGDYFSRFDLCWDKDPAPEKQLKHWLDPLTPDETPSNVQNLNGLSTNAENSAKRITNISEQDSLQTLSVIGGWGSIFGHNNLHSKRFAEHFEVSDSSMLLGVYIVVEKGRANTSNPIYIDVYSDKDGLPKELLSRELFNPSYLDYSARGLKYVSKSYYAHRENYHRFSKPISVGTNFHVGFEIDYPIATDMDTFQVYGVLNSNSSNTANLLWERKWIPYTEHPTNPIQTSLWIEPVLAKDTTHYINAVNDTTFYKTIQRPIILWSRTYSSLEIYFPNVWEGDTFVEVYNLSGILTRKMIVQPPKVILEMNTIKSDFYIIKLFNKTHNFRQKVFVGYE